MRILVTGAAGHLGSVVVQSLIDAGHEVVATDLEYRRGLAVPLQLADLCEPRAVYPLIDGCDAVLHLGNHPNPWVTRPRQRIMVENTAMNTHVFEAAREVGVKRLVFVSSVQVVSKIPAVRPWGPVPSAECALAYLPLDGDVPACTGLNLYAMSKRFGEEYLETMAEQEPQMSLVVARLPYVHHGEISAKQGYFRPLQPNDHRTREALTYLLAADACSALRACVERAGRGFHRYFFARSAAVRGMTAAEVAARYFKQVPLRHGSERLDELDELVDLGQPREALGWTPTEPRVTIGVAES